MSNETKELKEWMNPRHSLVGEDKNSLLEPDDLQFQRRLNREMVRSEDEEDQRN